MKVYIVSLIVQINFPHLYLSLSQALFGPLAHSADCGTSSQSSSPLLPSASSWKLLSGSFEGEAGVCVSTGASDSSSHCFRPPALLHLHYSRHRKSALEVNKQRNWIRKLGSQWKLKWYEKSFNQIEKYDVVTPSFSRH